MEAEDAAQALRCNRTRISHLETGRTVPSYPDLHILCDLYDSVERLEDLDKLREVANERGWWASYKLPPWLRDYLGLESDATGLRRFTLEVVPGMLQTKAYAEAVCRWAGTSENEIEHHVSARMERKTRFEAGEVNLSVVMDEALLRRTSSMGDVGLEQLEHLHWASGLPNLTLQMIPFTTGGHASMGSSFTLLDFPLGLMDSVAYQEFSISEGLIDDQRIIKLLDTQYAQLRSQALGDGDTVEVIERSIKKAKEIINAR